MGGGTPPSYPSSSSLRRRNSGSVPHGSSFGGAKATAGLPKEAFRQELGIPEQYGVLSVVAIGHKNEQKKPYTDADLDFTKVHYETF